MKNLISLSSFLFFYLLLAHGCSTAPEENIPAKPVVKKTSVNYNQETFNTYFPDTISLQNISRAYSNNFSEELRKALIDYMKGEVIKLGEDVNIFDNILFQTGCKLNGEYLLPTYAEKAKFENQDAWIFQVTYGLGEPNFGHYKCFAFSIENLDTLAYKGCR